MPIVEAVAVAVGGAIEHAARAERLQAALTKAIEVALAEGIPVTDSATMKARLEAAHAQALKEP